jgi:hypothetical protein
LFPTNNASGSFHQKSEKISRVVRMDSASSESRAAVIASFEATNRLLNDLEVAENAHNGLDLNMSNMEGLIGNLSSGTFDIHTDLSQILDNFSKGRITVSMLEDMVRTEHARSLTLSKMTGAMKVQLEEVFNMIEKVADAGEAALKIEKERNAASGENGGSSSSSGDAKELARQINSIYSDFSDVLQTVDSMQKVVQAPAIKVGQTIDDVHILIDSTLQKSPIARDRVTKTYDFASPKKIKAILTGNTTETHTTMTDGDITVGATEEDDVNVVGTEPLDTVQNDSMAAPKISVPQRDSGYNSGRLTPIKSIHVIASTECGSQTEKPDVISTSTMVDNVLVIPQMIAQKQKDPLDSLVIKGSKATGSMKDIQRAKQIIIEKEAMLVERETKLVEQQEILVARAAELRSVAQKVVAHESDTQRQMKYIEEIAQEKVREYIAQLASMSQENRELAIQNFDTYKRLPHACDEGKEEEMVDLNTRTFIEENIKNAQASHLGTNTNTDINDSIAFEKSEDLCVNGGGVVLNNVVRSSIQVNPSPFKKGENSFDQISPTMNVSIPSATYLENNNLKLDDNNSLGLGSMFSVNSKNHVVNNVMSPTPQIPPPSPTKNMPDMMVIFPVKTKDRSTTTDDLLFNGAKNKDRATKLIGNRRDRGSKAREKIMSDIIDGDSTSIVSNNSKNSRSSLISKSSGIKVVLGQLNKDPNLRPDLPTVATKDGFTTRTYRHVPPPDFKKELMDSENPLLTLYNEYKDCLPDVFHSNLLDAASGKSSLKAMNTFRGLFTSILPDIRKLDLTSGIVLNELSLCEDMANNLIVVMGSDEIADDLYYRSLNQMYTKFGEIEGLKLWVDVQIGQYRAIFDRVNSLNINMIPSMVKASDVFEESYEVFLSCSGRSVEAQARFTALKNRCKRYNVARNRDDSDGSGNQREGQFSTEEYLRMVDEVDYLKSELEEAVEEAEELNLEVFRVMQEGDRTPGALLFFAALHDPVTTNVLQQITLQLHALKGFASGSEHLQFDALRKRLQVCISCVPNVERFVQRYNNLHKKWVSNRLGLFTSKGQVGGGSDSVNLCPMCSNDHSKFTPPGGLVNRKSQEGAKRQRAKQKQEEAAALQRQQLQHYASVHAMKGKGKSVTVMGTIPSMNDSVSMGSMHSEMNSLPSLKGENKK